MIIKFFSHLNQSLSKLESTKFAPTPCTSVARAVVQQSSHTSVYQLCWKRVHVCIFSAPPLHCSTHRKYIKLKFILQIGYTVLLLGMFFLYNRPKAWSHLLYLHRTSVLCSVFCPAIQCPRIEYLFSARGCLGELDRVLGLGEPFLGELNLVLVLGEALTQARTPRVVLRPRPTALLCIYAVNRAGGLAENVINLWQMRHRVLSSVLDFSCPVCLWNSSLTTGRAGIFKQSLGARNRGGIEFSYRPARLNRLAELIPRYRFLGSLKV
jgi:hypothetical protein